MKYLAMALALLLPLLAQAQLVHTIESGSLHSGGSLEIKILEQRQDDFDIEISYKINPRMLVPLAEEYRSGQMVTTLPIEYLDENGYLDLQQSGTYQHNAADILYVGQENLNSLLDSHRVQIAPHNGKWKLDIWYHPSVELPSWPRLRLELTNVPLIGRYTVNSRLRN